VVVDNTALINGANTAQRIAANTTSCRAAIFSPAAAPRPSSRALQVAQQYQQQDLQVTVDYRDILAEIGSRRLGNQQLDLVFPGFAPTFRGAVA